jgi:hypothetical protein
MKSEPCGPSPPARGAPTTCREKLVKELELFPLTALISLTRRHPEDFRDALPLFRQRVKPEELKAWIDWKAADNAWYEARLDRVTRAAMWAAVIGAFAAIIAVVEGWTWPLPAGWLPWTH